MTYEECLKAKRDLNAELDAERKNLQAELAAKYHERRAELDAELKAIRKAENAKCRKTFADRLKFARQKTGLSQRAFAPKLNMSQKGYSLYETGQRDPSIPTLIRLSKIFNCSVDWLLGLAV